jgi:hypothetical protein
MKEKVNFRALAAALVALPLLLSSCGGDKINDPVVPNEPNEPNAPVVVPSELAVSPDPVKTGTNLTITGKDLNSVGSVTFPNVDKAAKLISASATQIVAVVDTLARDGDITLTLLNDETVTVAFTTLKPTIMAFDPPALMAGEEVFITGTDLDLVTEVIFAGEETPTVTIGEDNYVDQSTLKITVPLAATTCAPRLKLLNGMTAEADITLDITPDTEPVIATMPEATIPGGMITLTGSKLNYVESFYFGDTKVEYFDERSATSVTLQVPKYLPYADYKIKMVSYEGAEFLSYNTIKVQSPEITMWEGEIRMEWSVPGQVTVYRNVPDGLSDITNVGLTVGSKLILYYTTTDDGYQIQINNAHWNAANWGAIHTAGFYPDAPAGTNVKCEITLNAIQLDELLNLPASWGGSSCLNLQGAGCFLLKVCVRP